MRTDRDVVRLVTGSLPCRSSSGWSEQLSKDSDLFANGSFDVFRLKKLKIFLPLRISVSSTEF